MRTYHEGLEQALKTGTFYFGGNRNLLLWSDTPVKLPLALFFAATAAAVTLSGHPLVQGWPGIRKFYLCFVLLIVMSAFRGMPDVHRLVIVFTVLTTLSALWSLVQFVQDERGSRPRQGFPRVLHRRPPHHRLYEPLDGSRAWTVYKGSTLGALAILLVLTGAFYWKLTLTRDWTIFESPDLAIQVRPWLDYQAREFHAGRVALWDPYEWAGHTLIGQAQPGVANPLNWILFAMPLTDGHIPISTLHWYWVLIHWLAAVFFYALCRDIGASFTASIFGACIYTLTGFMSSLGWPQILMPCVWIPVVLLYFLRVVQGRRPASSAALCGVAMGLAFCGGHHVVPTFTLVLFSFLWLALMVRNPAHARWFALFLPIALLVSAVQTLPSIEYAKQAIRWADAPEPLVWGQHVPYSVHARYSLFLRELPALLLPLPATHVNPYLGITAFALAVYGLVRRGPLVKWLAALALGGILLALGGDFPPYWLIWRFVPMVEKAREPAFAIVLGQAGIAVLAALGASGLPRWAVPVALAAFLGEAVYHAPHFAHPGHLLSIEQTQSDIASFLKAQPGWFRVDLDENEVPYNFGDLHGVEQFGAALSSLPVRLHRVLGHEETPHVFGVAYRVARAPANAAQIEIFQSRSGLKVFRDPRIAQPMWGFHQPACAGPDRFRILSREPARVLMEADLACPGLAVIGDPYYPGWRAFVDGRRTVVQELDGVRAVRAQAGRHTIEFRYRPASVYWGFGLALAGLVLAASVTIFVK